MKQNRALLEAAVLFFSRQYTANRDILISPVGIAFSLIFLPFMAKFLEKADLFSRLRGSLSEPLRKLFWEEEFNRYFQKKGLKSHKIWKDPIINPEKFTFFESNIRSILLALDVEGRIVLPRMGLREINSENYADIVRTIPYQLRDLLHGNHHHTVFYVARIIDWIYARHKDPRFLNKYRNFLDFLMVFLPSFEDFSNVELIQFREVVEQGNHLNLNNCTRYAELIQSALPYYFSAQSGLEKKSAPVVLSRLANKLFWLGVGLAILANYFLIKPVLTRAINNTRLSFLNDDRYFGKALEVKNYKLLSTKTLISEKNKLKTALNIQGHNVKNIKMLEHFLLIAFFGYCLWNLFKDDDWANEIFAIIPIFFCLLSQSIKEKIESYQLTWQLNLLAAQLNTILQPCAGKYQIEKVNRGKLVYSYITVGIYFREELIINVIKSVLNHFNIVISSYDETNISLAAETSLNVPSIADFFQKTLIAAQAHDQIGRQLEEIISKMEPYVSLEPDFTDLLNPFWKIDNAELKSQHLDKLLGVTQETGFVKVTRNTLFNPNELKSLEKIRILYLPQLDAKAAPQDLFLPKKIKKIKLAEIDQKNLNKYASFKPNISQSATIHWPLVNVKFPDDKAVERVTNASHRFMLFSLPKAAFGNNSKAQEIFREKSTQMARKVDSQGIKHGHYFGSNFYTGQQQMFPARIKVFSGPHRDNGVLLSIETATTGEILYRTEAFAMNIH